MKVSIFTFICRAVVLHDRLNTVRRCIHLQCHLSVTTVAAAANRIIDQIITDKISAAANATTTTPTAIRSFLFSCLLSFSLCFPFYHCMIAQQ